MFRYIFPVFLGGCCYGVLSTVVKLAYAAGFTPGDTISGECLFGTVMLWIASLFVKKQRLTAGQVAKLLLSGIPTGLVPVFYYQSLETLPASIAVILLFQFTWMSTVFETVFLHHKPSARRLGALALLIIASVMAAGVFNETRPAASPAGIIYGLLAALSYAVLLFASGTVERDVPPVQKSAIMATGGLVIALLAVPPSFFQNVSYFWDFFRSYGLILGLLGIALPPFLFAVGVPHVGPALSSILTSMELPIAVICSRFILGEKVNAVQWCGVVLIFCAIILANVNVEHILKERKSRT